MYYPLHIFHYIKLCVLRFWTNVIVKVLYVPSIVQMTTKFVYSNSLLYFQFSSVQIATAMIYNLYA